MDQVFSPATLKKLVEYFIPDELIPSDWSCTENDPLVNLQSLFNKSSQKSGIRIYGSAKGILEHIQSSIYFPGSSQVYDLPEIQAYSAIPQIYLSLKSKMYLYKHDYFSVLYRPYRNLVSPLSALEKQLSDSIVTLYLREKEKLLSKNHEMVLMKNEDILELKECLAQYVMYFNSEFESNLEGSATFNIGDKIKSLFSSSLGPHFHRILEKFPLKIEDKRNNKFFMKVFTWTSLILAAFLSFISKHPEIFKANEKGLNNYNLTVRIFQDNKVKFIMAHELLEVMKFGGLDTSKVEMEVEKMGKLGTFDFRQVFEMVGKEMSKIEFIAVPRSSDSRTCTPIPSFNGEGYCLPASSVFFELINNLFTVKQVAQRYDWPYIQKFFETVVNQFFDSSNYQGIYFIDYEDVKRIRKLRDSYFSDRSTIANYRFLPNPFTVKKLKEEIEHLKLSKVFEEVHMEADRLEVEPSYFKFHYAFSAIKICQLRCLLRRLPKLAQFLHHQKSCEIYNLFECDICKGAVDSEEVIVPEDVASTSTAASQEEPEATSSPPENSESPTVVASKEDSTKSVTTQKKKKNKKTPFLKNPNENKESQNCQKCFRTSELCQKAQEDCKISNNKIKRLEKDLKNSEVKLERSEDRQLKAEQELQKMMEQMKKVQEENEMLKRLLAASKSQPEESKEPEEEELGDLECLICHDDMDDILNTLKCQNCCRRYHKDCLVGWFEKSRSCPVCDSEFEEGIEN